MKITNGIEGKQNNEGKRKIENVQVIKGRGEYRPRFRRRHLLLRGGIVHRTYGIHKTVPGIYLTIFTNNI